MYPLISKFKIKFFCTHGLMEIKVEIWNRVKIYNGLDYSINEIVSLLYR